MCESDDSMQDLDYAVEELQYLVNEVSTFSSTFD